jgi:DNA-binding MarR family transcriptional regulator
MPARLTYILLLSFAWKEGSCFPGQSRIASKLGVTRKAVNKYLKELKQKDYIDWHRRGMGKTNVYRILKMQVSRFKADVTKRLHQDVTTRSYQDVTKRLHKEYTDEEYSARKDSDHSKFRKGSTLQKNHTNAPREEQTSQETIHTRYKSKTSENEPLSSKITDVLDAFSKHDLHDPTHISSNITRALNLWRRSKLPEEEFLLLISKARKITLARSGSIRKKADNYMGLKNRAPYFFGVLQDLMEKNRLNQFRGALLRHTAM